MLVGGESVEELFFITSCIMDAMETQVCCNQDPHFNLSFIMI